MEKKVYPLLTTEDLFAQIAGGQIFSKLDMSTANPGWRQWKFVSGSYTKRTLSIHKSAIWSVNSSSNLPVFNGPDFAGIANSMLSWWYTHSNQNGRGAWYIVGANAGETREHRNKIKTGKMWILHGRTTVSWPLYQLHRYPPNWRKSTGHQTSTQTRKRKPAPCIFGTDELL